MTTATAEITNTLVDAEAFCAEVATAIKWLDGNDVPVLEYVYLQLCSSSIMLSTTDRFTLFNASVPLSADGATPNVGDNGPMVTLHLDDAKQFVKMFRPGSRGRDELMFTWRADGAFSVRNENGIEWDFDPETDDERQQQVSLYRTMNNILGWTEVINDEPHASPISIDPRFLVRFKPIARDPFGHHPIEFFPTENRKATCWRQGTRRLGVLMHKRPVED